LVKNALTPLLRELSFDLPDLARDLLEQHPKDYLNLFPAAEKPNDPLTNLAEFVSHCFSSDAWALRLRDIWNEPFDLLIGDGGIETAVELIPEWLLAYRDFFKDLSSERRRFVRFALGDALAARIGQGGSITIRRPVSTDVALKVLRHAEPPKAQDLERLLKIIIAAERRSSCVSRPASSTCLRNPPVIQSSSISAGSSCLSMTPIGFALTLVCPAFSLSFARFQ
jgi:hypothetical protein